MAKVPLSSLVIDNAVYPRTGVDHTHISDLIRSIQSGVTLPPIIIDAKTRAVVDGVHRVHAYRKLYGEGDEVEVEVEIRKYKTTADLFIDAVALNSQHGKKLDRQDQIRIVLKLRELQVEDKTISLALHIPEPTIHKLELRIVTDPDTGESLPAKRGIPATMFGKPMTTEQIEAMRSVRSAEVGRLCTELYKLIRTDLIDKDNPKITAQLRVLAGAIDEYLAALAA